MSEALKPSPRDLADNRPAAPGPIPNPRRPPWLAPQLRRECMGACPLTNIRPQRIKGKP